MNNSITSLKNGDFKVDPLNVKARNEAMNANSGRYSDEESTSGKTGV